MNDCFESSAIVKQVISLYGFTFPIRKLSGLGRCLKLVPASTEGEKSMTVLKGENPKELVLWADCQVDILKKKPEGICTSYMPFH